MKPRVIGTSCDHVLTETPKAPGESCDPAFLGSSMPLRKDSAAHDKASGDGTGGSNGTGCEQDPVRSNVRVVDTDTWKGQLDFERACSAAGPGERCWLSGDLTSWNQVLHTLGFELVEPLSGSVHLQTIHCSERNLDKPWDETAREASYLISWLLEHHQCIDRFGVYCDSSILEPLPIYMRPSLGPVRHIRQLKIELAEHGSSIFYNEEDCGHMFAPEGLDTVCGVEKLKVVSSRIKFKFAAELESLLRRNAATLKSVKFAKGRLPKNVDYALRSLVNCESLTLNAYWGERGQNMVSVAQLLRKTSALKKLSINPITQHKQMITLAEAIKVNNSLTHLIVHFGEYMSRPPESIFAALEANRTLKELQLSKCHINLFCALGLAKALLKNTSLCSLHITESQVSAHGMKLLGAALRVNTTLERLQISGRRLEFRGIFAVCASLAKNKTLKQLTLHNFQATTQERKALAQLLATCKSYSRVQLSWEQPDVHGLWIALTSPTVWPEEVCFHDSRCLSEEGFRLLFSAVALSEHVCTLRVRLKGSVRTKATALCDALKANRSIRTVDISIETDMGNVTHNIFYALAENKGITKVMIGFESIGKLRRTAKDISYFLAHNKTATTFYLTSMTPFLFSKFVSPFSKGMWQNKFIVDFKLGRVMSCSDESFTVCEAVRRNKAALNRAVDFVLEHKADRNSAEAFELFSKTPLVLSRVVGLTGKTEAEVLLDIVSATNFLIDNYLIITGVVQSSVECHPAEGTQADALNKDCWRAIVRHLSIADVLVPY